MRCIDEASTPISSVLPSTVHDELRRTQPRDVLQSPRTKQYSAPSPAVDERCAACRSCEKACRKSLARRGQHNRRTSSIFVSHRHGEVSRHPGIAGSRRAVPEVLREISTCADGCEQLLSFGESTRGEYFDSAELAAYALLANAVLNLDETVNRN